MTALRIEEGHAWYALEARPKMAPAVALSITALGFPVFLPFERRTVQHARKSESKLYPLITGYLFVAFNVAIAGWQEIVSDNVPGAISLLGQRDSASFGGFRPTKIRAGEIEHLMTIAEQLSQEQAENDGPLPVLPPRSRALIFVGVLANLTGEVIHDERGRVLMTLDKQFGGKPVSVPRESVRGA